MAKICFLGAGSSVFARQVLGDCMHADCLRDAEITLVDIDRQRLQDSETMLRNINAAVGSDVTLESYPAEDARADNNFALRWACRYGHLATAQWLTERFQLTAADARAEDNCALQCACGHGHLATARLLATCSRFGIARVRMTARPPCHPMTCQCFCAVVDFATCCRAHANQSVSVLRCIPSRQATAEWLPDRARSIS